MVGPVTTVKVVALLGSVVLLLMVSTFTGVDLLIEPSSADLPMHSLEVSLYPGELTAKVTEDQLGAVTFGGNVTVEKPQGVERVTVTLSGSVSSGWPVAISPTTIAFINPRTQRFSATVIVPPATLASVQEVLTVTAIAKSPIWDDEATAIATVKVAQYIKANVTILEGSGEAVDKGETFVGKFRINNTGNGQDIFTVELVTGMKFIESMDMPDPVMIPPGQYADVTFSFTIKDDLDMGVGEASYQTFTLRISSTAMQEQGVAYTKNLPFYVKIMTFTGKIVENWLVITIWIAVTVVVVVTPLYLLRRFRRARAASIEQPASGDGEPMTESTEAPIGPRP